MELLKTKNEALQAEKQELEDKLATVQEMV
jgi:hypothetical protein